jgi:hypothetical protein
MQEYPQTVLLPMFHTCGKPTLIWTAQSDTKSSGNDNV